MTSLCRHNTLTVCLAASLLLVGGCASLADWENVQLPIRPPNKADTSDKTDMQFGVARMLERNGSWNDAQKIYSNLLSENPDHVPSLHRLGVVAMQLEQLDAALESLLKASEIEAPSVELLADLGYAQFLSGDHDAAETTLRRAVEMTPDHERAVNNLAMVVGSQGRIEESLMLFRRVGSESEAQSNLAFVLARINRVEDAKQHYHLALERDPKLKQAAKGLAEFYRLPDKPSQSSSSL